MAKSRCCGGDANSTLFDFLEASYGLMPDRSPAEVREPQAAGSMDRSDGLAVVRCAALTVATLAGPTHPKA